MIDFEGKGAFGARALARLNSDYVGWLTTVDLDGTPEPSPVWFFWEAGTVLIYSRPNQRKLTNIARNNRVSFSFNCTETGGDVVIFTGSAVVDPDAPAAIDHAAYIEKYAGGITGIGMTNQSFSDTYSVPIRIDLDSLRGH